jgi:flagellar biosynthesis/type III secretory pathway ATPase
MIPRSLGVHETSNGGHLIMADHIRIEQSKHEARIYRKMTGERCTVVREMKQTERLVAESAGASQKFVWLLPFFTNEP